MDPSTPSSSSKIRPLSPHIQIYKPQLTSILSIMHRGTGVMLTLVAFMSVLGLYALKGMGDHALAAPLFQSCIHSFFGMMFMIVATFSLFFHMGNGVRHLFWDIGKGFDLKTAYISGYAVLILSILGTFIIVGGFL